MNIEPLFIKDAVYQSATHGKVVYKGIDTYMGQRSFIFESITYGGTCYWGEKSLADHFDQERIKQNEN